MHAKKKTTADKTIDLPLHVLLARHSQVMKKLENRLENVFPDKFRSRYAMVCYGGVFGLNNILELLDYPDRHVVHSVNTPTMRPSP